MKTAAEILESKLPLIFNHSTDAFKEAFLEAMEEYRNQPSDVSDSFSLPKIDIKGISRVLSKNLQEGKIEMVSINIAQLIEEIVNEADGQIKPTIEEEKLTIEEAMQVYPDLCFCADSTYTKGICDKCNKKCD